MKSIRAVSMLLLALSCETSLGATALQFSDRRVARDKHGHKSKDGAFKDAAFKLLSTQEFTSMEEFERAAQATEKSGISKQTIDELRLMVAIRLRSLQSLPPILSNLNRHLATWHRADPYVFYKKSDLQAAIYLATALLAENANNETGFETAIMKSFRAAPEISDILLEVVEEHRSKQHLALILPLDLQLETAAGTNTSLRELVRGQKALLLDFWASWCGPCMQSMDELKSRAESLSVQRVPVVGINVEAAGKGGIDEARKKARRVKREKKIDFAWVVEPTDQPLTKLLNVETLPRAVLVSPKGKILFDGHPNNPELSAALKRIGIDL